MGKIKSAWEIALERTESIVIDEDKIRRNARLEKIKRISGAFLNAEEGEEKNLEALSSYDKKDVREALKTVLLSSISLNPNPVNEKRIERLSFLSTFALESEEDHALYVKLLQLVAQYPEHRKQLIEQLEESLEPGLRQKEEMMKSQYGQQVHLTIEDDKEAREIVKQNLEKLDSEYQKLMEGAKAQLENSMSR